MYTAEQAHIIHPFVKQPEPAFENLNSDNVEGWSNPSAEHFLGIKSRVAFGVLQKRLRLAVCLCPLHSCAGLSQLIVYQFLSFCSAHLLSSDFVQVDSNLRQVASGRVF